MNTNPEGKDMFSLENLYGFSDYRELNNILLGKSPTEIKQRFWTRPPRFFPIVFKEVGDFLVTNTICLESLISDGFNFHYAINEIADQLIQAEKVFQELHGQNVKFEWVCQSDEITPCNPDKNHGYYRFYIGKND